MTPPKIMSSEWMEQVREQVAMQIPGSALVWAYARTAMDESGKHFDLGQFREAAEKARFAADLLQTLEGK